MKNKIKSARLKEGYTQGQLARKLKVTQSTISLIERGKCLPSHTVTIGIIKLFGEGVFIRRKSKKKKKTKIKKKV